MRLSRVLRGFMAAAIALATLAATPAPVAAGGDQLQTKGVSTYEVVPSRHVIHVTTVFTLTNKAPSKSARFDCSYWVATYYGSYYVSRTCTRRTNYYYNAYNLGVEQDAVNLKVKASSGSASIKPGKTDGSWRKAKVKMSPLWYGKTRTLTVSYDLPAGGPRATASRKAGYAYAEFCAYGPGSDKGEVRIVVPSGYALTGTSAMTKSTASGKTTYRSLFMNAKPWAFQACVDGPNANASDATAFTTPAGRSISIQAWKDDPSWAANVTAVVSEDLPLLEAVLGGAPSASTLSIREVRAAASGGNPFDSAANELAIGENVLDRGTVTDALTNALWLPKASFGRGWIHGGYAAWAGDQAGTSAVPCTEPGATPTGEPIDLTSWVPASPWSTEEDKAAWAQKQQAACWIVGQVNAAVGKEAAMTLLASVRNGERAWAAPAADATGGTSAAGGTGTAAAGGTGTAAAGGTGTVPETITWQAWLDLVTERGLIPAGADPKLASDLLVRYGITTDTDVMAAHAAAREAYHALEALTGGTVPADATEALRTWDDAAVQAAAFAATTAWKTAGDVEAVLPDVKADGGAVRKAVLAATTQAELDAAVTAANDQLAMAKDVAAALEVAIAPRDAIQELGLAGKAVPDGSEAIAAVVAVDATAADAAVAETRSIVEGSRDAGTQRAAMIGGGVLGALLLLALGVILVIRRRPSRETAGAGTVSPAPPSMEPPAPPA